MQLIWFFFKQARGDSFVCTFDTYSFGNNNVCGGIDYSITSGNGQFSGLQLDQLPNQKLTYITDFTSISN